MTDRNNLTAELRRTADTMRELGDLAKAELLNRAADYIEEKHLQCDEMPPAAPNYCLCCGAIIPKSRQLCPQCESDILKV